MKKVTLFVVMAFVAFAMTSCENKEAKKKAILAEVETYFSNAEQKMAEINNAEDFIAFYDDFNAGQSAFLESLYAKFPIDENEKFKGFTDEEDKEINTAIYDRATDFNNKTAEKCAEYLTPRIDNFEIATKQALEEFNANGQISDETKDQVGRAYEEIMLFSDFDNVPTELQDRFAAITSELETITVEEETEE